MRVAIRVDAGPLIGGGHAMRCLALADALAERGAAISFVAATMPQEIGNRIEASGHKLVRIAAPHGFDRTGDDWHQPPLDGVEQQADAHASGVAVGAADWMIVDHYLLDARWHSAARSFAGKLLVIDDLANREYDCDLLLDQTLDRSSSDYQRLVPHEATVLAGPIYALLRPEFAKERGPALKRRKEPASDPCILISMGTADIGGSTAKVLAEVVATAPHRRVDVVLGSEAPSLDHVRELGKANSRICIHVNVRDMASLMRDADVAIGAAGTTSWERCCLGLPAVTVVLAENQRSSATALANAGAVIAVNDPAEIGDPLRQLLGNPDRLAQMSAAAFAITDGRGAQRVSGWMLSEAEHRLGEIELRRATPHDAELLWLWRNDPVTRTQSRNTEPISWKSHLHWLAGALAEPRRQILVALSRGVPVATLGLHGLDGRGAEISITVAPDQRGSGIGRSVLRAASERFATEDLYASVRDGNDRSRRLFESCAFKAVESTEPGFARYLRPADDCRRKHA